MSHESGEQEFVVIPNDYSETRGDTLDQGYEDCSDCPSRMCQKIVVVYNSRNNHDVHYVCGWCLSTQIWPDYWKIKRVYFSQSKSSVLGNRQISVIHFPKRDVEKDGEILKKYDTYETKI